MRMKSPATAFRIAAMTLVCGLSVIPPIAMADNPSPLGVHPELSAIARDVSAQSLHEVDAKLVGFGTRSTLSDTKSDTRGIGAARRWVKSRFDAISRDCGG